MTSSKSTNGSEVTGRAALVVALASLFMASSGCAGSRAASRGEESGPEQTATRADPLEGFNRGVYRFNDAIDRHALRPVAVAYRDHTPGWLRKGVGNFFTNLFYPTTVVNQFLQGKFKEGSQDLGRFVLNTTLGWAGLFDVASGAKLPVHDEDAGQTLGRWGVPAGPYLVLPLLGPSTVRDTPMLVVDEYTRPFEWYDAGNERYFSIALYYVDKRAGLLQLDGVLAETYDPYAFVRDAYLQRRQYEVYDGDPPEDAIEDESDWAEEALREDATSTSGDAPEPGQEAIAPSPDAAAEPADDEPASSP